MNEPTVNTKDNVIELWGPYDHNERITIQGGFRVPKGVFVNGVPRSYCADVHLGYAKLIIFGRDE